MGLPFDERPTRLHVVCQITPKKRCQISGTLTLDFGQADWQIHGTSDHD